MNSRTLVQPYLLLTIFLLGFGTACLSQAPSNSEKLYGKDFEKGQKDAKYQECLMLMQKSVGADSEIFKYGDLNGDGGLEAISVVNIPKKSVRPNEFCVMRLTIFKYYSNGWGMALDASENYIQNPDGYVGLSYLPAPKIENYVGYMFGLFDHREDGSKGLTIKIVGLGKDLEQRDDDWPIEISWNPIAKKYQQYQIEQKLNSEKFIFVPEVRNPPRRYEEGQGQNKGVPAKKGVPKQKI